MTGCSKEVRSGGMLKGSQGCMTGGPTADPVGMAGGTGSSTVPPGGGATFREQLAAVCGWLSEWSECEQTVALYAILRRLSVQQSRFLEHLLQQASAASEEVSQSLDKAEDCANSKLHVERLHNLDEEVCLTQLLQFFPLLHPGNESAKGEYLKVIPKVLGRCIERRVQADDCRHLLTYVLIHPAISNNERTLFTKWLAELEHQHTIKLLNAQLTQNFVQDLDPTSVAQWAAAPAASVAPPTAPPSATPLGEDRSSAALAAAAAATIGAESLGGGGGNLPFGGRESGGAGVGVIGEPFGEGGLGALAGPGAFNGAPMRVSEPPSGQTYSDAVATGTAAMMPPERSYEAAMTAGGRGADSTASGASRPMGGGAGMYRPPHHRPLASTASAPLVKANRHQADGGGGGAHLALTRTRSVRPGGGLGGTAVTGGGMTSAAGSMGSASGAWGSSGAIGRGHQALSPQSSLSSSGSDHQDDERLKFTRGSGMKDFPAWMKVLRLHKYTDLFADMTYEQMMAVDCEWLEKKGVTKGATKKLAGNVEKLRERPATLRKMEQEVTKGVNLLGYLQELRSVIVSPIKPYRKKAEELCPPSVTTDDGLSPEGDQQTEVGRTGEDSAAVSPRSSATSTSVAANQIPDGDLAGLITKVMGRMCTQLVIMPNKVEAECFPLYATLVDKCMVIEAFQPTHRKSLNTWKTHVQHTSPRNAHHGSGASGATFPFQGGQGQHAPAGLSHSLHSGGRVGAGGYHQVALGSQVGGHKKVIPTRSHSGAFTSSGGGGAKQPHFGGGGGMMNRGGWSRPVKSPSIQRVMDTWGPATSGGGASQGTGGGGIASSANKMPLKMAYSNPDGAMLHQSGAGGSTGTSPPGASSMVSAPPKHTLDVPMRSSVSRTYSAPIPGPGSGGPIKLAPGAGITLPYHHPHHQVAPAGGGGASRGGHAPLGRTASHHHHHHQHHHGNSGGGGALGQMCGLSTGGREGGSSQELRLGGAEGAGGSGRQSPVDTALTTQEREEMDENLRDLCISVTECALGTSDSDERASGAPTTEL